MQIAEFAVISIESDGRQLTASGYTNFEAVRDHIDERVRNKSLSSFDRTPFAGFVVVVSTRDDRFRTPPSIIVHHFDGNGKVTTR